jgi:hypothetical protein
VQDEQIDMLKENEGMKLLVEIYMSELSRIRYLLRAYLRVRLQKVERHVMHILDNAGGGQLLLLGRAANGLIFTQPLLHAAARRVLVMPSTA